jgi:hypothetical protein
MPDPRFHDAPLLKRLADNLYHGWGYNFYRAENHLRADDQLIRQKVGWLLGRAREQLEHALAAYRRAHIPLPTRAKPLPDPDALAAAARIEELATLVGALEGSVRTLPVPENDRMTQRLRGERETLSRLCDYDSHLIGRAQLFLDQVDSQDPEQILANLATLRDAIALMKQGVQERQTLLLSPDRIVGWGGPT